jgi:hypothetical protein
MTALSGAASSLHKDESSMRIHHSVTPGRVMEAVERHHTTLDNPGFCVQCGAEVEGVEPDARNLECEACGQTGVYGAEELLIMTAW